MVRCTVAPLRKLNKIIVKGNLIWTFVFAHSFLSPGNIAQGIFIWTFFARLFLSPGNIAQDLDFFVNSYLFPGNTAQGILILSCLSSPKHFIFYQYHFSFLVLFLFVNIFWDCCRKYLMVRQSVAELRLPLQNLSLLPFLFNFFSWLVIYLFSAWSRMGFFSSANFFWDCCRKYRMVSQSVAELRPSSKSYHYYFCFLVFFLFSALWSMRVLFLSGNLFWDSCRKYRMVSQSVAE